MGKVKVLVIGGGVAGPACCYWLKRFGFEPILVEKFGELRKGGQALDIRGVAVDLVKKMGIYDDICKKRTTLECGRYVDASGHILHDEIGERAGFRQDDEVEILRGDLIDILMGTIEGVPCYFNRLVSRIDQNEVYFSDGTHEHFDLIIGADGIHSATRRMVFAQDEYKLVDLGSYLSIFTIPNYLGLVNTEVLFESDQKMASITSDRNSSTARAAFMLRSQESVKHIRDEAVQKQFLRDTFKGFGWQSDKMLELMDSSPDFYFDSITQVKMPSWTKGRVALVGDSGYCPSPLSGQGNNLALVGAYILAGELKKAKGDYNSAFARYNALLHPFVEANQKFGAWVSESFLVDEEVSKEIAEERSNMILKEMKLVSNGISLPDYA